ncbi:MAG: hypothetical protein M1511_17460 [Deltaproteobacteria bacterium]|nr:hypothetical protein [Deltaproteobacteria bacterium]
MRCQQQSVAISATRATLASSDSGRCSLRVMPARETLMRRHGQEVIALRAMLVARNGSPLQALRTALLPPN